MNMTMLVILQLIVVIVILIELIILRKSRTALDILIVKFVDLAQGLYNKIEANNKKVSDNLGNLTKTLQTAITIKNNATLLDSAVKELSNVSKYIKVGAMKEFKEVEEGIRKIKTAMRQEK